MIITELKTALSTAGCTAVYYENDQLTNVKLDEVGPSDIVGVIIEPNTMTLVVAGNGVTEQYPPVVVEIMKQVKPEDSAENNYDTLNSLVSVAKIFVHALIRSGSFKKIQNVQATKITERKYDANVIGWSLALNISPIENKLNC